MSLSVAELSASLTLDDREFQQGIDRTQDGLSGLERAGQRMTSVGDSMSRNVTLPVVAAGTAAFHTAVNFDTAMSRITGLVGVAEDEVDDMREGVLSLAGETAKSPQELADALFTVTSAGFRGAEAMDVLEMSAKASAAGLGETRDIAEAVTATINTYGADVIDAAQATDVLVATAQAGNFATEELSAALGRVLPTANAANVSFEDLGGSIALMTRQNNDANQSITQAEALFRSFVRPTTQARDILLSVGLTADDVRSSLGERGLVTTLEMLEGRLEEQTGSTALAREELGRIIEDSSGFSAALQILDADMETINSTFGTTADSAGMLEDAWSSFAGSGGFEAQQAMARLQEALIRIGDIIIPIASDVLGFAADMLESFSALPDPVLKTVVAIAAVGAALGPVLSIGGRLVLTLQTLRTAMQTARGAMSRMNMSSGAMGAAMGGVTAAVGLAVYAWQDHQRAQAAAEAENRRYRDALEETRGAITGATADLVAQRLEAFDVIPVLNRMGLGLDDVTTALEGSDEDWNRFVVGVRDAAEAEGVHGLQLQFLAGGLSQTRDRIMDNRDALEEMGIFTGEASGEMEGLANVSPDAEQALEDVGMDVSAASDEFDAAAGAVENYIDALASLMDPLFAVQDSGTAVRDAQVALTEAQDDLNAAIEEHGEGSDEAAEAQRRLEDAEWAAIDAEREHEAAMLRLADAVDRNDVELSDAHDQLDQWAEQAGLSEEATQRLHDEFDFMAAGSSNAADKLGLVGGAADGTKGSIDKLDASAKRANPIRMGVSGASGAKADIDRVGAALGRLPKTHNIGIQVSSFGSAFGVEFHSGGVVPGPAGQETAAVLMAGEEVLTEDDPRHSAQLRQMLDAAGGSLAPDEGPAMPHLPAVGGGPDRLDLELAVTGSGGLATLVQQGIRDGSIRVRVAKDGRLVA